MVLSEILVQQAVLFILLLTRLSGMIVSAPVFGSRYMPNQIKIAFSLIMALAFVPLFSVEVIPEQIHLMYLISSLFMELMIGIAIGLIANVLFSAVQIAGQVIDIQMGYIIGRVVDPQFGAQVPLVGQFKYLFTILVFLAINGHHLFIRAVVESYDFIPMGGIADLGAGGIIISQAMSTMFYLALQVSAPALATLFLTNIVLGILARTVPQMNVFMVGFPFKMFVGLLVLGLVIPYYDLVLDRMFQHIWDYLHEFLQVL